MTSGKTSAHYRSLLLAFNEVSEQGGGKFRILLLRLPRHLVLRVEGKVAIAHSQSLVDKVRPILAAKGGPVDLVVDLSRCDHLASSAVGFIAFVAMAMSKRGGLVYLVHASPALLSMLKVLGVDKVLRTAASVAEAVGEE